MARMSAARSNRPRLNLPMWSLIAGTRLVRTRRNACARGGFRSRRRLVVNWSRGIAPERYIERHRQGNGHEARELVGADA